MATRRPVITLLVLGLFTLTLSIGCGGPSNPNVERVVIEGQTFTLEIAADAEARERGLMHRQTIPSGTGMLFIFPDVRPLTFFMKNCLTDMDIIILDTWGRVTATHRMKAEPPRRGDETEDDYDVRLKKYHSRFPSQFAIELPSGTLDQLNVRVEDKIELDLDRLKALTR